MKNNNISIKLDYKELNDVLRGKSDELLAYNGVRKDGSSYVDDEILTHRFWYLEGTKYFSELLGCLLKASEDCMAFQCFFEYDGRPYMAYGSVYDMCSGMQGTCVEYETIVTCDEYIDVDEILYNWTDLETDKVPDELKKIINACRGDISCEYHKCVQWYKDYFTKMAAQCHTPQ